MSSREGLSARYTRWMHRLVARWSSLARPAIGFVSQPEPRTIGSFARGRQLLAGNYLFAGHLIEAKGVRIWDVDAPDTLFEDEIHGFVWLDDLASVGDPQTRELAADWLWGWIELYGSGKGPGWTPDLTGRRIIRWIHHALFVLRGQEQAASDAFYRSLAQQTIFLSRRWHKATPGLPRFEALTGLIYAGLALEGMEKHVAPAVKARHADGLAMGYARLGGGRTSIIVDAAAPPGAKASGNAHASTLAFELTSGRRPVVVNCGSGAVFGADWRRAGRATPSHSTLSIEGYSSSRFGTSTAKAELLIDVPRDVPVQLSQSIDGMLFEGGHDGYLKTHGLTHARTLELSLDGRGLSGEDLLVAIEPSDRQRFDKALTRSQLQGVPFQVRFHLHPDVDATVDMGGAAISLALKSGELWVFRHDGALKMTLEPSVYLEKGRLRPRATKQIVLSGRAMDYATRIRWTLAKAQETPISIRDLNRDEPDLT